MTYEQLDMIADAYVPALWLACLVRLAFQILKVKTYLQIIEFLSIPVVVYGWMYLDQLAHIWPNLGMDYSTHAAAALGGCYYLRAIHKLRWVLVGSLTLYFALMLYQKYHSAVDIASTSLVVGANLYALKHAIKRMRNTLFPLSNSSY